VFGGASFSAWLPAVESSSTDASHPCSSGKKKNAHQPRAAANSEKRLLLSHFTHAFDKRARGAVRASKIGSTRQVTLRALARATHWW
jgi:hypothetical protein